MALLLLLQMLSSAVSPQVVTGYVDQGFITTNATHQTYYYNSSDLKSKSPVKVGDRVIGIYMPSLQDESEFVGVIKW
jgi:hypothetical protein